MNLSKGESLNLTKKAPGLSTVVLGAGWDVAAGGPAIDLDLIVVGVNADGKAKEDNFCFFNHKSAAGGAIVHSGDNRTGEGDGDDETVTINLDKLAADITRVHALLTFYNHNGRDLGMVANAHIRAINGADNAELAKFPITSGISGKTIYFADLVRGADGWEFKAIGESSADDFQSGQVSAKFGL